MTKTKSTNKNSNPAMKNSKANIKRSGNKSYGIGYYVNKGRNNITILDEFFTTADSYLHYSNNILFEINRSSTALLILMIITDSSGCIVKLLLLISEKSRRIKNIPLVYRGKIFDGIIERYCGVPP
ncbi:MAG: hypothetical protein IPL53_19790 [Ignavibacteria bacterium]|nr:hypothetical protein [Ignavibacteria bacterium]